MLVDDVDRKILSLLRGDCRLTYAEIGKRVFLSAPAVHARVKKMEKNGVITGYTLKLRPEALDAPLCAFIRIVRNKGVAAGVASKLMMNKQIEECHSVAGEDCMIVKVRARSSQDLAMILDQIRQIEGIDRTTTAVVLETHFERGLQP